MNAPPPRPKRVGEGLLLSSPECFGRPWFPVGCEGGSQCPSRWQMEPSESGADADFISERLSSLFTQLHLTK